jgi:PAS domain S-box-containing protein
LNSKGVKMAKEQKFDGLNTTMIHQLKKKIEELKEEKERYTELFERSNDANVLVTIDGKIFGANKKFEEISGLSEKKAINKSLMTLLPSPEKQKNKEKFIECLKKGEIDFDTKTLTKDKGLRDINVRAKVLNISGKPFVQAIVRDITEKKRAEDALKESKAFTESALNSITDMFYSFDLRGKFLSWNKTFNRISGYSDQELSSKKPTDFFLGEDIQRIAEAVKRIYKEGTSSVDANFVLKDGRQIPCEFTGSILKDGKGNIIGFSGTGRDITERKKAEDALRKSEEKFRSLFESTNDGLMITDITTGKIISANPAAARMLGYNLNEIIGMLAPKLYQNPEERKSIIEELKKTGYATVNFKLKKKNGNLIHILGSCHLKGDRIESILKDITETKEAEEQIRESKEKYRILLENLPQKIFLKDINSTYISCNKNYAKDLKIKPEQIKSRTDYEFYPKKLAEKYRADDKKVMKEGKIVDIEERYIQDGNEVFVHTVKIPVKDEKGSVTGVLGIFWDITGQKRAEDALRERFEIETAIAKVLFNFVCPRNINKAINSALAKIGALRNANRAYLFLMRKDEKTMDNTHEWCAKGVKPQIKNLQNCPVNAFPWWMKKLGKKEIIHIPDISKMPKEAKAEKKILEAQNIKSLLVLPINSRKELIGFIGFDNTKEAKPWRKADIILLSSVAKIIGMSLDTEQKLLENKEKCKKCLLVKKLKLKHEF